MSDIEPLRRTARLWLAMRRPSIEVQVLEARGSVPREAGTRMLVAADAVAGTIGGGHLELQAIRQARAWLAGGLQSDLPGDGPHCQPDAAHPAGPHGAQVRDQHYALGPSLGQCCGGALTLRSQPLSAAGLAAWPALAPLFTLQLYGAGHVGRAIAALLAPLPCRVSWIDERESEFPGDPSPTHIERLCVEPVDAEVRQAPPGAFYLVLTHDHALDLAITDAILRRGDFGFLGLIGSATKRAKFLHRFEQRGLPDSALARLTCPIGVPGVAGKQPEVIALAVVAQLLQQASASAALADAGQDRASRASASVSSTRSV